MGCRKTYLQHPMDTPNVSTLLSIHLNIVLLILREVPILNAI